MLGGVPLYRKVQKGLDRVTSLTRENLTGVRVIRAFRKEAEETERFDKANRAQTAMQNTVGRIAALMNPLTLLIIDGGIIALLYSGAIQVDAGIMTKGDVFALTNYMSQILVELVKLANTVIMINKGFAGAARIEAVLAEPTGMSVDDSLPAPANAAGTAVAFDRVGLTYSEGAEPSLTDISFTAAPGETIGIIGSTGSGKTSVVNLIARFYDATEGTVAVSKRVPPRRCGKRSASFRKRRCCSVEPCAPICSGGATARPTTSCGWLWSRRRRSPLWKRKRADWTRPLRRTERISRAVSGNG